MTMDRSIKTGRSTAPRRALAVTTALAGLALTSCTTSAAPRADASYSSAHTALAKGEVDKAIMHAEAAVLGEPRNPGYRVLLGAAYLEAGRFDSAATSFGDALDLGDENPRTVLSFALAKIALGESRAAVAVLDQHAQAIDPTDLGLALALAGQPERGVQVLVKAVRSSESASPMLRQNLAYTYALAGNWRAARVMAAEDVPADQVDARLVEWAALSPPEKFQQRIATLLNVTPRADSGQPQRLALANFPSDAVMMAEAAAQSPVELAAAAPVTEPAAPTATFALASAAPDLAIQTAVPEGSGPRFESSPVVQQLPASAPRMAVATPQRRMAATVASAKAPAAATSDKGARTHLVQLGSYDSKVEAERGWTVLKGKFPQLREHKPVITQAVVNGRTFWRVAADGFGPASARGMCSTVKSAGRGCFAYAASSPPAGAVQRDSQVASRAK